MTTTNTIIRTKTAYRNLGLGDVALITRDLHAHVQYRVSLWINNQLLSRYCLLVRTKSGWACEYRNLDTGNWTSGEGRTQLAAIAALIAAIRNA